MDAVARRSPVRATKDGRPSRTDHSRLLQCVDCRYSDLLSSQASPGHNVASDLSMRRCLSSAPPNSGRPHFPDARVETSPQTAEQMAPSISVEGPSETDHDS